MNVLYRRHFLANHIKSSFPKEGENGELPMQSSHIDVPLDLEP